MKKLRWLAGILAACALLLAACVGAAAQSAIASSSAAVSAAGQKTVLYAEVQSAVGSVLTLSTGTVGTVGADSSAAAGSASAGLVIENFTADGASLTVVADAGLSVTRQTETGTAPAAASEIRAGDLVQLVGSGGGDAFVPQSLCILRTDAAAQPAPAGGAQNSAS